MRTLINQLSSGDRLLHRAAQRLIQSILDRSNKSAAATNALFPSLLMSASGSVGFDQATKTKTLEKMVNNAKPESFEVLADTLATYFSQPGVTDIKQGQNRRQNAADLLVAVFGHSLSDSTSEDISSRAQNKILKTLVQFAYFTPADGNGVASANVPPVTASTRQVAQMRLLNCLERAMKVSGSEATALDTTVNEIRRLEKKRKSWKLAVDMNEGIRTTIDGGWTALETLGSQTGPDQSALKMLIQLSILQVYNGEPEAVEIIEELGNFAQDSQLRKQAESADSIVEVLLTFSSKPSKFLRRITLQVFQTFAPSVTASGLQSLLRVSI